MKLLLAIAAGGALGALGRHYVAGAVMRAAGLGFPLGTLTVNVLGSFLMGVLIEFFARHVSPPMELRGFLAVGFLGAFTTFSTFSLDVAVLVQRGQFGLAALYILLSVSASIAGLFAGLWAVKLVG